MRFALVLKPTHSSGSKREPVASVESDQGTVACYCSNIRGYVRSNCPNCSTTRGASTDYRRM